MKNMIVWVEKKSKKMVPLTPSWPTAKEGECGDRSSGVSDPFQTSGTHSNSGDSSRKRRTVLTIWIWRSKTGDGTLQRGQDKVGRSRKTVREGGMRHLLPSQVEEGLKMQKEILQEGNTSERGIESPGKKGDSRRSPLPYSSGAE